MSKLLLMSLALGLCMASMAGWCEAYEENTGNRLLITGAVSYDAEVPEEIYGTWHRSRILVESNFPERFQKIETGYWTISKSEDRLTLSNPETGASTTVHVESVNHNTATFHYVSSLTDGTPCKEELVLTAADDSLKGTQKKVCSVSSRQQYYVIAKVEGYRLDQGPAIEIFR